MATAVRSEAAATAQAPAAAPQRTRPPPPHDDEQEPAAAAAAAHMPPRQLDPDHTRSLLLILHGKRVDDELVRDALTTLKQQGHRVSVKATFDRGDVEAFVGEAVQLNDAAGAPRYQTIVAGGGDGTLNEVVCALLSHQDAIRRQGLAVALLPLGTANDFACATGISVDPLVALQTALDPTNIRLIDVAKVNGRAFVNTAVVGRIASFSPAELASQSRWKKLFGPAAIAVQVLRRAFQPRALQPFKQATITFCHEPAASPGPDGGTTTTSSSSKSSTLKADLLMLAAGNSRQMGRSVNVCPDALLDDGLLDFTLLTGESLAAQAAGLLGALASADPDESPCDSGICQLRASWLRIESAQALTAKEGGGGAGGQDLLPINRDGEPEEPSTSLLFEVLPQVLPMHLPDDRMLQTWGSLAAERASSASSDITTPSIRGTIHGSTGLGSADSKQQQQPGGKKQHRRKKLRKKTLLQMVSAVQPEGLAVRQRQQTAAVLRQLTSWGLVLLAGGALGWAVRARRERREQRQQRSQQQQQRGGRRGAGGRPKVVTYDL